MSAAKKAAVPLPAIFSRQALRAAVASADMDTLRAADTAGDSFLGGGADKFALVYLACEHGHLDVVRFFLDHIVPRLNCQGGESAALMFFVWGSFSYTASATYRQTWRRRRGRGRLDARCRVCQQARALSRCPVSD